MKIEVIFREREWSLIKSIFISGGQNESAAVAFCRVIKKKKLNRYMVVEAVYPNSKDLPIRSPGYVRMGPEFMERCFQKCEKEGLHMIDIHTHPFTDQPTFSSIDDHKDAEVKGPYFDQYLLGVELLFIVCGRDPENLDARMWDKDSHSLKQVDLIKIL